MVIGDGCSQDTVGNCKEGVINCTCYKCIPYFSKLIFCYAIIFVIRPRVLNSPPKKVVLLRFFHFHSIQMLISQSNG